MTAREQLRKLRWLPKRPVETWVGGNTVQLFTHGDVAFEHMLQAIEGAQRRVWLEMYWFAADTVGLRFFQALGAAARRGVEVALLYDGWGSFGTPRTHFEQLRRTGALVAEFNPISPLEQRFRLGSLTRRNHRKLLIVDGQMAFTGGQNIADEWTATIHRQRWKDEVVRVEGPVVPTLEASFLESWREAPSDGSDTAASPQAPRGDPVWPELREGVNVAVLTQAGVRQRRGALRAYLQRLRGADRSIDIANAYFLPNPALVRGLISAAKRGVDVRIILAGKSDVPLVTFASRAVWGRLLRAGVRLYEWRQSVLHSKIAVVDGSWVTLGSFNLDYVSLRRNRELNLAIDDANFAAIATVEFEAMLRVCEQVQGETFRKRSIATRLLERLAYSLRTWL